MRGEYLELHRNRTLLNILAERLDVEVAVDLRQTVMDLVAVFLDRRAVRSVLDGHELLQDIGQLVVSVCYAEDDEAFVQWREMMWGAAKGDFRPTVQGGGEEAQFDEVLDELGGGGLSGEDLGEDFVTTAQVGKTRDVPWEGAKVLIEFAGAGVDESTRGIDGGWEAEASRGGGSGFDCHSDDWYVCVWGWGGGGAGYGVIDGLIMALAGKVGGGGRGGMRVFCTGCGCDGYLVVSSRDNGK